MTNLVRVLALVALLVACLTPAWADGPRLEHVVVATLVANAALMCTEHRGEGAWLDRAQGAGEVLFTLVYVAEVAIKAAHRGARAFARDAQLALAAACTLASVVDSALFLANASGACGAGSGADALLRLVRALRVLRLARLAAQIDVVTNAFVNRTPWAARASMRGVESVGCPAQPSWSKRWSSVTTTRMFGRSTRGASTAS